MEGKGTTGFRTQDRDGPSTLCSDVMRRLLSTSAESSVIVCTGTYARKVATTYLIGTGGCMHPARSYIVAATPRTGSSLLCEGLAATGIAGVPAEVFAPDFRQMWNEHWAIPSETSFREYVSNAIMRGTSPNGVFGLKIQWMHVAVLAWKWGSPGIDGTILDLLFPDSRFVNIVRRNRLAQAISWYRAIATNRWWMFEHENQRTSKDITLTLDASTIGELQDEIARQQGAWEDFLRDRHVPWLVVDYESLDEDYRGQVARVLEFLGLDKSAARGIPGPRLVRQADEVSLRWRQQLEGIPRGTGREVAP